MKTIKIIHEHAHFILGMLLKNNTWRNLQTFICPFLLLHIHKQQSTKQNVKLTNNENKTKQKQKTKKPSK
jgi:hypothetical protein